MTRLFTNVLFSSWVLPASILYSTYFCTLRNMYSGTVLRVRKDDRATSACACTWTELSTVLCVWWPIEEHGDVAAEVQLYSTTL